jgi:putative sterol carrier protein
MDDTGMAIKTVLNARVAPRFADQVRDAQPRLEAAQREVDDLRAARGSIAWTVEGLGTVYLNIDGGQMAVGDQPLEEPFMIASQSAADWSRFAEGTVASGFLTGSNRRSLGKSRIDRLRPLRGSLRFILTGFADGDWTVTTFYGPGPHPAEPRATVRLAAEIAQQLQNGDVNPQLAFMQGQVRLEGDAAFAMQLGMAMLL